MKESNKLRIGYFADGPWSHNALEILIRNPNFEICFICARFNEPDPVLKEKAKNFNLDFITTVDVNDPEFFNTLKNYNCDLFVSMSFDQIMKERVFKLPEFGTINCHAGKLPLYRGRNILNWVLINDEKEFGITVHYIDKGIDSGDIICQEVFPISDADTYLTLLEKAYEECPKLLFKAIELIRLGNFHRIKQDTLGLKGFYCCKRQKGDEIINWEDNSRDLFNFIRAITYPGPCAITFCSSIQVNVIASELLDNSPCYKGIPGAIIAKDDSGLLVKTGDSFLKITQWESSINLKVGMRFNS